MSRARLALLVSGGGRTALNIAERCRGIRAERRALDAEVALVVAHREDAPAVARCRADGLRVAILPATAGVGTAELDDRIDAVLEAAGVDLVCLAGYLRRFRVGERWAGRALNIHPGLLPAFGGHGMYGDRVHQAVLAAGARESGCTVHEVDGEYDRGPIVLERRCTVEPTDGVASLAARVFRLECEAYPEAIARHLARHAAYPILERAR
jgi:phosphoribosylglycinamide formyltransferase-1